MAVSEWALNRGMAEFCPGFVQTADSGFGFEFGSGRLVTAIWRRVMDFKALESVRRP
ncbi:MAG: hypothetical protein ACK4IT_06405 [Thioalkalivibrionaceae bacterium]